MERRPLKTRQQNWARRLAAGLVRIRLTPNLISAFSMVWAAFAAGALLLLPWSQAPWQVIALALAAAIGIQMRLLCNMLDGMVAVEGGLKSATGELWNEVPDRVADSLICVAAGYACSGLPGAEALGWSVALLAMMTAYIRALGGQLGLPGCFHGPMAKPHRMFTLTLACLVTASLAVTDVWPHVLWWALVLILVGTIITCIRRLRAIVRHLRA